MRIKAIRIRKGARVFHVHGDDAGAEGVWLAEGQVEGIYDAPVKTTWKTGAFQDGSTQKAYKKLHRDMPLGFHITDTADHTYEYNESAFLRIFDYQLDPWENPPAKTVLEIETDLSGTRKLDVLMYEQSDFSPKIDSIQNQHGNVIVKLRAGQPMWYQDDVTTVPSGSSITISNPTDQIMRHEWMLEPGTWSVPDVSWAGSPGARAPGGGFSTRHIPVTVTAEDQYARISLDRQKLMIRNAANSNILARLGGVAFAFPIPPYTQTQTLTITGGSGATLYQPRRWSRPWGLEIS